MAERHSIRFFVAILSAIAIWVAALMQALQAFGVTHDESVEFPRGNETLWQSLDPKTMRGFWTFKQSQGGIDGAIDILFSLGLLCLTYCVLCLKRVFRRWTKDSDLPNFMTGCFFFGAIVPCLQFLQTVGTTTTSNWVANWQDLPDVGYQILYVSNVLEQGGGIYTLSVQFLFVSIGIVIASHLSWKTGDLPKKHAILGGITAACGFVTFILEFLTFQSAGTDAAWGFFILIWGIILIPIWTIWLGVELKRLRDEVDVTRIEGRSLNDDGTGTVEPTNI